MKEVAPPVVIRVEGEVAAGEGVDGVPLFHSVSLLDACHVRRISETSYCIRLSQKCPDPRYSGKRENNICVLKQSFQLGPAC